MLILTLATGYGQNLYDAAHSQRFANYLMQSRQYGLASEEFERLVFLYPGNDTLKNGLLRAFRLGGKPADGLKRWNEWQQQAFSPGPFLQTEYTKLLLWNKDYAGVHQVCAQAGNMDASFAQRMNLYATLLEQSWPEAEQQLEQWPANQRIAKRAEFEMLVKKGLNTRYKKPGLATALSVVVPGAGKAYAGQWKDGAISLLFVGLNTWQAYRRFDKEGLDTFWGWIHGGFAMGFYIGNLYGSHKAARLHNDKKRRDLYNETSLLVFPALD